MYEVVAHRGDYGWVDESQKYGTVHRVYSRVWEMFSHNLNGRGRGEGRGRGCREEKVRKLEREELESV